jgi:RNA polymerase sigma-70 factor (ECF subfamily)
MTVVQALPRRLASWITAELDWDEVYAEHLPRVLNYFRYRLGPTADVEDLTARTFEKAWRARHRYRRDLAGFSTWLLTIARNVATDHMRAVSATPARRRPGRSLARPHPEQHALRQSDAERLARCSRRWSRGSAN